MSPEAMGFTPVMMALFGLLGLVGLVSFIWVVVLAFKENVLWGLGCLFVPLIIIVFGIVYWQKAKKPFMVYVICSIILAAMYVKIIYAVVSESGAIDLNAQVETGQITEQEAQQRIEQKMAEMFGIDPSQMPGADKPQTAEDKASSLTEQMNERARQAEQAAPAPADAKRIKVYNAFKLSQAPQHMGETIRIVSKTGVEKQGKLKEVKYDRLVLERNLAGGDFAFEVPFDDIKTIEAEAWETF